MECRKAEMADIPAIMDLVKEAQTFLKEQGIDQWQDGYPSLETIQKDIKEQESYLFFDAENMLGYVTVVLHKEEIYNKLLEGAWINESNPQGAMHHVMLSSKARGKGLSKILFDKGIDTCKQAGKKSIRIDTHPDNYRMQHLIEKNGFVKCGSIQLTRGNTMRFVYEKLL